ncbi:MAG: aminoacyl-tRNA hydrolase [Planctomycetaceae bacterium]|nr:MAG: aminoacyl-tRNA hydrolase [Planctomycetaceae bacterium]
MLRVHPRIQIPLAEFHWTYARSSGPGGQNVNKVNSKVTLHWPIASSPSLPDDVRARAMAKYAKRINNQGDLVLHSQRYRDQAKNVSDCLEKLSQLLLEVAVPPKRRIATRPSRAAKQRRVDEKKSRGKKKDLRKKPKLDD